MVLTVAVDEKFSFRVCVDCTYEASLSVGRIRVLTDTDLTMPAWVLPDYVADVLPFEAWQIERLRRCLLDTAQTYGYELVIPPLLEHLDSLLTGSGEALDLQTFKLVDQLSGRSLGLRADTTSQVARIDAHLLNLSGITRLCYCGPVLHVRPDRPHATREPLQFGAEIYGHGGLEADLEILQLAQMCLQAAGVKGASIDLADARIVQTLLSGTGSSIDSTNRIHAALTAKDRGELQFLTRNFPAVAREGIIALVQLYGDSSVLAEANRVLGHVNGMSDVLANLAWIASHVGSSAVTFDLSDLRGYAYYSGLRFSIYASGASSALIRGGRYDEVGVAFGRSRTAAGFSMDIKQLISLVESPAVNTSIRAPWGFDADLCISVATLRNAGETVVCMLPGHEYEAREFQGNRELVKVAGLWVVRAI